MSRADTVGIVGAGPFGAGLAAALARVGRPVVLWSRDAAVVASIRDRRICSRLPHVALGDSLVATVDPIELAARARFIVMAVASTDVRARARELGEFLDGNHIVVHAVGALAEPNNERVSDVVAAGISSLRIGVLAGPALPLEMANGTFASMVVASHYDEVVSEGRRLLNVPPGLRMYGSKDLVGVELASALSGAYAIGLGLADGMGVGPGPRAVMITRAIAESSRLGVAVGAEARTFTGLAGLGNLLVRSDRSYASQEYRLGQQLAAGSAVRSADPAVRDIEGAHAARTLLKLAERHKVYVPLLRGIAGVLAGTLTAEQAAQAAADTVAAQE